MVLVNTDYIAGQKLQTISIVRGSVVMTKHIGSDIGASFKTIIGGEINAYTDMLNNAREIATSRLVGYAGSVRDTGCRNRRQVHSLNGRVTNVRRKKERNPGQNKEHHDG